MRIIKGRPRGARGRPKGLPYLVLALALGFAQPASAQIYTWRDANGTLVLSNRPRPGAPLRTYAVPRTESMRTTRLVPAERSRAYDDLISLGGMNEAKSKGRLRLEGKEYLVKDGDIVHIRSSL